MVRKEWKKQVSPYGAWVRPAKIINIDFDTDKKGVITWYLYENGSVIRKSKHKSKILKYAKGYMEKH